MKANPTCLIALVPLLIGGAVQAATFPSVRLSETSLQLSWEPSSIGTEASGFDVTTLGEFRSAVSVGRTAETTFTVTGLATDTHYYYFEVVAFNDDGQRSPMVRASSSSSGHGSSTIAIRPPCAIDSSPTAPKNVLIVVIDAFAAAGAGAEWIRQHQAAGYHIGVFSSSTLQSPAFDRTVFASVPELRLSSEGESPSERDRSSIDALERYPIRTERGAVFHLQGKILNLGFFGWVRTMLTSSLIARVVFPLLILMIESLRIPVVLHLIS